MKSRSLLSTSVTVLAILFLLLHSLSGSSAKESWDASSFGFNVVWVDGWNQNANAVTENSAFLRLTSRQDPSVSIEVYVWKLGLMEPAEIADEFLESYRSEVNSLSVISKWQDDSNGFSPSSIQFKVSGNDVFEKIFPRNVALIGFAMVAVVRFDSAVSSERSNQIASSVAVSGSWGYSSILGPYRVENSPSIQATFNSAASIAPTATVSPTRTPTTSANSSDCSGYESWNQTVASWIPDISDAQSALDPGHDSGSLANPLVTAQQLLDPLLNQMLKLKYPPEAATASQYLAQTISAFVNGNWAAGSAAYAAFQQEFARLEEVCG